MLPRPTQILACTLAVALPAAATAAAPEQLETIIVHGHPLSAGGTAQAIAVLSGDELDRQRAATLGATVAREPGVHTSSFGAAVGRPVIHGLGATRVGILEDRIASMDVSVTSDDHATTIEPFVADSIEILKGASTLLYGSGSIGGSVNVQTGRIPHSQPERPVTGRMELRGDNNADQRTAVIRLDGVVESAATGAVLWHLDAVDRSQGDYDIPGLAESGRLHGLEATEDDDHAPAGRNSVPNSGLDTKGAAFGLSVLRPWGLVGASISSYQANYGLPGGHEHDEGIAGADAGSDDVTLDLNQVRLDLEAVVYTPMPGIEELSLRFGHNRYDHQEIEGANPDGEAVLGTRFDNTSWEARIEATHQTLFGGWDGVVGVQLGERDFAAVGEEAFVLPTETKTAALYALEERNFRYLSIEAGARVERVEHQTAADVSRDFTNVSLSLGGILPVSDSVNLRLQLDSASRAPVPEELFANGAHLATQSFERGDADLDQERALNLSLSADWTLGPVDLRGTLYRTDFSDFIYRQATGAVIDDLPERRWLQNNAEFTGLDLAMTWQAWSGTALGRNAELTLHGLFDTVRARVDDHSRGSTNLPRIPATRYGLTLDGQLGAVHAGLAWMRVLAQKDVQQDELPTSGFHDLGLNLRADVFQGRTPITLFLAGHNLLDAEQRNAVSFLKDRVPLPGRTIEGGVRVQF